jgi:DNA repair exonuclease SbcCD ATPase subunit
LSSLVEFHELIRAALQEIVGELASCVRQSQEQTLTQLDGLAQLAGSLAERESSLDRRQAELERALVTLEEKTQELEARQRCLAKAKAESVPQEAQSNADELASLRSALAAAQAELASLQSERDSALNNDARQQVDQQRQEIERLRADLEAAQLQTARLAASAMDLADARQEIMRLREELTHSQMAAHEELNARITDLLRERTELELELEAVRNRAAELLEEGEEERRRMSEERAHWAGELRQLRRALEAQSQALSEKEAELRAVQAPAISALPLAGQDAAAAAAVRKDPVLDAVMAQFQRLQQERIARRNQDKPGKQEVA